MKTTLAAVLMLLSASLCTIPAQAQSRPSGFVSDPQVREFAKNLCIDMMTAGETGKDVVAVMEDQMLGYLQLSRATPNYSDKIIAFWNAHTNDFICKGRVDSATRESEHLLKRAIALSMHNHVLYKFLLNHEDTDVNAVEWVVPDPNASSTQANLTHAPWGTGEPETVVDYLDKILADPEASEKFVVSDVARLRKDLVKYYGGKTAKALGY
ncbi:hypothetical protein NOR53_1723 [gamma proteobacterium NOR5-3]|nr:hypothetical protein NOR53_1723 [gamma proteobacterium NOR5-3]